MIPPGAWWGLPVPSSPRLKLCQDTGCAYEREGFSRCPSGECVEAHQEGEDSRAVHPACDLQQARSR